MKQYLRVYFIFGSLLLAAAPAVMGQDAASLQFTAAAPDPVVAGEEVRFQTLVVNSGGSVWQKGSFYWAAEVYTIEGGNRKFLAQTGIVSPQENVPPGGAHGAQIPFVVPDYLAGKKLQYRVFLVKDGRRLLETDYKNFQIIAKEFRPPPPEEFKIGGDISLSYKNSSPDGWSSHQGVSAANIVGKFRESSFLFNTYILHSFHKPITPTVVLLNYYAPWGVLGVGDIAPTLTPLSMDSQGMRGISYDRQSGRFGFAGLIGRIVAPQEPGDNSGGRFARYSGGFKTSWQAASKFKITADAVLNRDDEHSINISSTAFTIKPQQNLVYGVFTEWQLPASFTLLSDFQFSYFDKDLNTSKNSVSGTAWKNELKYRSSWAGIRGSVARITPKFASFASPSVISDRMQYEGEAGLYPAPWDTVTLAYNSYTDNLGKDASKATTTQTQSNISNTLQILGRTLFNSSLLLNTAKGKPAGTIDNKTSTINLSLTQPIDVHMINLGYQISAFKDNTGLSHNLDSRLISFSGSFRLGPRVGLSAGCVQTASRDKVDNTTGNNLSLTGSVSYAMPKKSLAYQLWTTLSTNKNDSLIYRADAQSLSVNLETVWAMSRNSRFTFGLGENSRTDKINPGNDLKEITFLTRYNYSF